MSIQLIFVVETTKNNNSDWLYINNAVKYFYIDDNKAKLSCVYMNTKTRYNSDSVISKISQQIKDYSDRDSIVIYCCDYDSPDINHSDMLLNDRIESFCIKNKYELIWFGRNIEEVFKGHDVNNNEKQKEAQRFVANLEIKKVKIANLQSKVIGNHKSNFLLVLDKYLNKK